VKHEWVECRWRGHDGNASRWRVHHVHVRHVRGAVAALGCCPSVLLALKQPEGQRSHVLRQ
jgi:hypothetical protein